VLVILELGIQPSVSQEALNNPIGSGFKIQSVAMSS